MAATLGAGLVEPGAICDVLGTAEPVCAVADLPLRDRTQIAECHPHAAPGRWLLESPGWASGASYRWFRDQLGGGLDYEGLNALAAEAPAGADGLVFLPWMGGAMAPRWEADARGGWYGLTPAHSRAHMARAMLEGSAHALRDVVEAIAAAGLDCSRDRVRRRRRPLAARPPDAGRRDGASRHVVGGRRDDGPRRGDAGRGGVGAPPVDRRGGARRWRASRHQVHEPDPAGAEACAEGHRRYRADLRRPGGSVRRAGMRAVLLTAHGGPEVLQPATVPDPEPGPGQVRVDLVRAALNHRDVWIREGRPGPLPAILGSDGAGVVSEVGADVAGLGGRRRGRDQPGARLGRRRGRARARTSASSGGPTRAPTPSGSWCRRHQVQAAPGRLVVGRVRRPSRWPGSRPGERSGWPAPGRVGGSW